MLKLHLEIIHSHDMDPHCMFGGCVLYLTLRGIDLLCISRSYVLFLVAVIHGSIVYHYYPLRGYHHRSAVYWSAAMIGLDKFGYWSYMSVSLFSFVSNRKICKLFHLSPSSSFILWGAFYCTWKSHTVFQPSKEFHVSY